MLQKYSKLVIGQLPPNSQPKQAETAPIHKLTQNSFGDAIPFGDPAYLQGWHSPYFNESHYALRKAIRAYVDSEVAPYAEQWDEDGNIPKQVILKGAKLGILALVSGNPWPIKYCPEKVVCGYKLDQTDTFHEAVLYEELTRPACGGVFNGLIIGTCIGLPPILKFGSEELKERILRPIYNGEKLTCLAVTEPWAGSDVANI